MTQAVELAVLVGSQPVDEALGHAAEAGCFGESDLASILAHGPPSPLQVVRADGSFSARPGSSARGKVLPVSCPGSPGAT
jgi:hypothetical protein